MKLLKVFALMFLTGPILASIEDGKFDPPPYADSAFGAEYPDGNKTPGAIILKDPPQKFDEEGRLAHKVGLSAKEVCADGYVEKMRKKLDRNVRDAAWRNYGLKPGTAGYRLDHLVPLSLGGSNDLENLWPMKIRHGFGALEKDRVEYELRKAVCSEKMELFDAQFRIGRDWYADYVRILREKARRIH